MILSVRTTLYRVDFQGSPNAELFFHILQVNWVETHFCSSWLVEGWSNPWLKAPILECWPFWRDLCLWWRLGNFKDILRNSDSNHIHFSNLYSWWFTEETKFRIRDTMGAIFFKLEFKLFMNGWEFFDGRHCWLIFYQLVENIDINPRTISEGICI